VACLQKLVLQGLRTDITTRVRVELSSLSGAAQLTSLTLSSLSGAAQLTSLTLGLMCVTHWSGITRLAALQELTLDAVSRVAEAEAAGQQEALELDLSPLSQQPAAAHQPAPVGPKHPQPAGHQQPAGAAAPRAP
jgi:hypothetical protein